LSNLVSKLARHSGSIFGRESAYVLNPNHLGREELDLINELNLTFENIRLLDTNRIYNLRVNYFDFICATTENINYMDGLIKLIRFGLKKNGYFIQIIDSSVRVRYSVKLSVPELELIDDKFFLIKSNYACRIYKK